jgi:hypothetical protein
MGVVLAKWNGMVALECATNVQVIYRNDRKVESMVTLASLGLRDGFPGGKDVGKRCR